MTIKDISQPVENHLIEFNNYFKNSMKSNVSLLNLIIRYMTRKRGKQVRPTMVFLSAMLCGGINQRSYVGAALVELLHTATLIHDDVVDQSDKRRGIATINAEWNNKIAVLIGDYLLGKGLLAAIDKDEFQFLKATSEAVRRMSEGELLQIQKSREINIDEETYFKIISDKTASLISTCCEIGAISATDDREKQLVMKEYGELVGIAFQIRDDIFDYTGKSSTIGKPIGNDLKEKKITLPLLYSFSKVDKSKVKELVKIIKSDKLQNKNINEIVDFVKSNGGIEYSEKIAMEYAENAIKKLEIFDDSIAKNSLINFAKFVIERNK